LFSFDIPPNFFIDAVEIPIGKYFLVMQIKNPPFWRVSKGKRFSLFVWHICFSSGK